MKNAFESWPNKKQRQLYILKFSSREKFAVASTRMGITADDITGRIKKLRWLAVFFSASAAINSLGLITQQLKGGGTGRLIYDVCIVLASLFIAAYYSRHRAQLLDQQLSNEWSFSNLRDTLIRALKNDG